MSSTAGPERSGASVEVAGVAKRFAPRKGAHVDALVDVDLAVEPGEVVALLGPSGCGKTTLLRAVAGLERPDRGTVRVGDRELSGPGTWVPPERRRVGLVFQDWALFPHLDVGANVAYGLPRGTDPSVVADALDLVGLRDLADRMPGSLSGGQQQRVALARALAPRPSVLLLDEPFSNLDTALRVQVRGEVRRLLGGLGITSVFVTHDQGEAFVLGDRVAVMHAGRIVQYAPPAELYERPATPWVASFVGDANLLDGDGNGVGAGTPCGVVELVDPASGPLTVLARPEELRLGVGDTATVVGVEYHGHDTLYLVELDGGPSVRVRETSAPRWSAGQRVTVGHSERPALAWPAAVSAPAPS